MEQLFKWERVIKKMEWFLTPKNLYKLILTENYFYIYSNNSRWKIRRDKFMNFKVIDEIDRSIIIIFDVKLNTHIITCTDRLYFLKIFDFLDKV